MSPTSPREEATRMPLEARRLKQKRTGTYPPPAPVTSTVTLQAPWEARFNKNALIKYPRDSSNTKLSPSI